MTDFTINMSYDVFIFNHVLTYYPTTKNYYQLLYLYAIYMYIVTRGDKQKYSLKVNAKANSALTRY